MHVTHMLYQTTQSPVFLALSRVSMQTKDICISKQENTTYIWYFDKTKNFFVRVFLEMRLRKRVRAFQFIDLAELEKLSAERVRLTI
jgi:hypothetical protein